jgi:hypothetical protein
MGILVVEFGADADFRVDRDGLSDALNFLPSVRDRLVLMEQTDACRFGIGSSSNHHNESRWC